MRAQGDGFARGVHIGKELVDLVQASIGFYHRYLDRRGVSSEQLQDLLTPYLLAAETSYPESMNVLKGMSIGAMVPILELFAINAFEELEPLLESPEGELLFLQRKEGYVQAPIVHAEPAAGALLEPVRAAPRHHVDRPQRALARRGSGQRRRPDRPPRGRARPGRVPDRRLLPSGRRAERPRLRPGHRIADRGRRRRGRAAGAGVAELARGPLPCRRDRQGRHARQGGWLRARLRVPRRRVHGGNDGTRTPGARSRRAAHQPLPGSRTGAPRAAAVRRQPGPADPPAGAARRATSSVARRSHGPHARPRLRAAGDLPAPRTGRKATRPPR